MLQRRAYGHQPSVACISKSTERALREAALNNSAGGAAHNSSSGSPMHYSQKQVHPAALLHEALPGDRSNFDAASTAPPVSCPAVSGASALVSESGTTSSGSRKRTAQEAFAAVPAAVRSLGDRVIIHVDVGEPEPRQ